MSKSRKAQAPPAKSFGSHLSEWIVYASIVVFTLWQGSYFPLQFMLMLALLMAAFVLAGRTAIISIEPLLLFAISLLYFLSLGIFSENRYAGLVEAIRTLVLPLSLITFRNSDSARTEKAIFAALMCVAILGLLSFASIIYIPGGVIEESNRLQSVIQYANTTALLMLVGALYAAEMFFARRKIANLVCCAIFLVSLVLTGSRTTLVVALAACFLYAFVKTGRRGRIIEACSLVAAVCAVVCLNALTDIRLFRISLYEPTLVERWITYGDAAAMMRGKWLTGIGAGNWQEWQFRLQSAPYNVKYVHNHYIQLLLDAGALAPLLFFAATVPAICKGLRSKSLHSIILIAIMAHAVLDFDLIFGAVAMIAMYSLSQLASGGKTIKIGKIRFAVIAPLLAVVVLWGSEAFSALGDSALARGRMESAMGEYRASLALNPLNTGLYYQMAQSTRDIELTEEYIRTAIDENPRDSRSISILALIESRNGNYGAALGLCKQLMENRKFSEEHQLLYLEIAGQAAALGIIGDREHEEVMEEIAAIRRQANPLYIQYIENEENGK